MPPRARVEGVLLLLLLCSSLIVSSSNPRRVRAPSSDNSRFHKSNIHGFSFTPLEGFHLAGSHENTRSINDHPAVVSPLPVDDMFMAKLYNYVESVAQLDPLVASINPFTTAGRHSLSHVSTSTDPHIDGALQYTFQQVYKGHVVWGTFVKVHTVNHSHTITHINGVFLQEYLLINPANSATNISLQSAEHIALQAIASSLDIISRHTTATTTAATTTIVINSSLLLYHDGLTRNQHADTILAFQVVIGVTEPQPQPQGVYSTSSLPSSKYYVFVDATTGNVVNQFSNRQSALSREVWQTQYLARSPVFTEGGTQPTALDAQNIIKYSGDVYSIFKNMLKRDSFDGKGGKMIGVYNIPANNPTLGCPVQAFWDGTTINFCATMARTDVAVHEWTHAYTEHTQALVYQYQSGALNEAYSDIVAEGLQIILGIPAPYAVRPDINDCVTISGTSTKRWMVGDELTQFVQFFPGGLRDMYNPNCQGDPRHTQDKNVAIGTADNGGVHTNSGIASQGFSILSDGGTLNDATVNGIGVVKALAIYLRAMAVYQGPTTNFAGHAIALTKSCSDLVGLNLPDPKTGAESNLVISRGDCVQVANAMRATLMEEDLPTSPSAKPPIPIIVNGFPSVGPVSTAGASPTLFVLASPNLLSDTIYCGFSKNGKQIDSTVNGLVISTESFTSAVCPLPDTWTTPNQNCFVTISADGESFASRGALKFSLYADPVIISVSPLYISEEGGHVTIKGSGFQQYNGCTINIVPDAYEGMPDCLTCIFGSFDSDHPVAAVYVDSTTVTCRVPARNKLTHPYTRAAVLFSMNNQVFYPLRDVIFAISSPLGMGGSIATIIVPLSIALVLIGAVLLAFHGMSPAFMKPVDEQLKGLTQSDDGSERGGYLFKYLRSALIEMVLLCLQFVWTVTLAGTTHTVVSIYEVLVTIFASASLLFGFLVTKHGKGGLVFVAFVLVITNVVVMAVGFALICVLISQFHEAAMVSGTSQDAQIVLAVAVLMVHTLNTVLQGIIAKYEYKLHHEFPSKGLRDLMSAEGYGDPRERDLSHITYSNAP